MIERLHNPLYNALYNDGLEYAARWIEAQAASNPSPGVALFAANMAMSIRAAKLDPNFQIDFADAVRNDIAMSPEHKSYWLALAAETAEQK